MATLAAGVKGLHCKSFHPAPPGGKKRPASARGRRPTPEVEGNGALNECLVGAEKDATTNNFKTVDFSLLNIGLHHSAKHDTFQTPRVQAGRKEVKEDDVSAYPPRKDDDRIASAADAGVDRLALDRAFFNAMQDKILVAIRAEVREEGTRARGFVKKSIQELKSEILTDVAALQQSFTRGSSKVVEQVAASLEENKAETTDSLGQIMGAVRDCEVRVEASSTRLYQGILDNERKQEVCSSEVLKALDSLKTRVDGAGASNTEAILSTVKEGHIGIEAGIRASLTQASSLHAGHTDILAELKHLRDGRLEVDLSEFSQVVLQAVKEKSPEAELKDVLATLRELKVEISKFPALETSITELRQVADVCTGTYITSGVADLCGAMEAFREERERLLANIVEIRDGQSHQTLQSDIKQLSQFGAERELRRGQWEQDIRESIHSLQELKTFGGPNLQKLIDGVDRTQHTMNCVSDLLAAKLDVQHVEAAGILEKLVTTLEVRDQQFLDILTAIDPDKKQTQNAARKQWEV